MASPHFIANRPESPQTEARSTRRQRSCLFRAVPVPDRQRDRDRDQKNMAASACSLAAGAWSGSRFHERSDATSSRGRTSFAPLDSGRRPPFPSSGGCVAIWVFLRHLEHFAAMKASGDVRRACSWVHVIFCRVLFPPRICLHSLPRAGAFLVRMGLCARSPCFLHSSDEGFCSPRCLTIRRKIDK